MMYFLGIEVYQFGEQGFEAHLSDFWNYLDILPGINIIVADLIEHYGPRHDQHDFVVRILFSITALAMWLRFLYFFRVLRETSQFITMIIRVIQDMSQFLLIFFITILAFSHVFYLIFQNYVYPISEDPDL
jgi:hypothetical protein